MVQLNRLEGFYWVAKEGGYAKAARAFPYPITQPAVHQQVKKLEKEVGVALFERIGKDKIVLTAAGQRMFDFVAPFYTGLPRVVRHAQSGEAEGEFHIESAPIFVRHIVPAWLRRLQKKHPGIAIELSEMRDQTCDRLLGGETDLIIGFLPKVPKGVSTQRVATLYPFLVHPSNHALAKRKRIGVKDITGEVFLGYAKGSVMRKLQEQELRQAGAHPGQIITTDSVDVILGFVASGLGVSLIPFLTPEGPKLHGLTARPIGGKRHRYPVHAAWRESANDSPLLQAVLGLAPSPEES